jgi:hypothetical protein
MFPASYLQYSDNDGYILGFVGIQHQSGTFLGMERTMKRVLVVLIMMSMVEAKDDLENIVMEMKREMRMEMNERIVLMEEKQMKTHEDCEKNQEELKKTQMELKKT